MIPFSRPNYTYEDLAAAMQALLRRQVDPSKDATSFRNELADFWGVDPDWILLTGSGTTALQLALLATGHRRISSPVLTWPATYCAPSVTDVQPLDVDAEGIACGPAAHYAVVLVALWGRRLTADHLARFKDHCVIVDSSHDVARSYGSAIRDGTVRAACYSFGPLKEITTLRGGALVMPDASLWSSYIRCGVDAYRIPRALHGINGTITEPGAALGIRQLRRFHEDADERRRVLERYEAAFAELDGVRLLTRPATHSGHLAVLQVADVARVRSALSAHHVMCGHHYPFPAWGADLDQKVPRTLGLSRSVVTIPCYRDLPSGAITDTINAVRSACARP